MAARFSFNTASANRCSCAVACSSAQIFPILDTVMILAVSICVLCLRVITT